jgi:subtilisin-like proprotein convertase family protein
MKKILLFICYLMVQNLSYAQVYTLNGALNGQTVTTCRGLFRDSGGGTSATCGPYQNNENRRVTFCSGTPGRPIRVSFLWWDIETGFDRLIVHDGPSIAAPQLIAFTGSGLNSEIPNFYTSSGECLTFRFVSDNIVAWCGWEAIIGCEPEPCNGNAPASDICSSSPTICDFEGYCGNTSGWYTPDLANIGATGSSVFCGSIENNSWVSFIADDTDASFRITSENCADNRTGIQAIIMSAPNCSNFTAVSNCVNQQGGPGIFNLSNTTPLVPGNRYYIMIDGFAGNICDYSIVPLNGVRALNLEGPNNGAICENQTTTLTLTGAGPGATYEWQPAAAIIGPNTGASILANPGTSTTNYTVSVVSPSGCGAQTLSYDLKVNGLDLNISGNSKLCEGESTTLTASAASSLGTVFFSNNNAVVIPDNNATGINSNITVSGLPGTVGTQLTSVCLDITHSYVEDLEVQLRCPSGNTINLVTRRGGSGDNFSGTCFAANGPGIATGVPPFSATYTPEQPISNLAGCLKNGTWTLIVKDRAGGDIGTLLGWSLAFQNTIQYTWSPATGLNTTSGPVVVATPSVTTTYTITASDFIGCSQTELITVNVLSTNGIRLPPLGPQCSGTTLNFSASPSGGNGVFDMNWVVATSPQTVGSGNIISFTPTNITGANIQIPVTFTVVSDGKTCTQSFSPTILPELIPVIAPIESFCSGAVAPNLPTSTSNGVTGIWSPAVISNSASGVYTFSPNPGQCAEPVTLDVTVIDQVTPVFSDIPPLCSGSVAPSLPSSSGNGIVGSWSPAVINNLVSANYTFLPDAGQCAESVALNVVVLDKALPIFDPIDPICLGNPAPVLPVVSSNSISGTWNPELVSNTNSGIYTFIPDSDTCAEELSIEVLVIPSEATSAIYHD